MVFHQGWNFGTDRKFYPSTGNVKGPEAKKEDCKDQPRKKTEMSFKLPTEFPPKQKNDKKNAKKKHVIPSQ